MQKFLDKFHNIKQKIIFYVMAVSILLAFLITLIMSVGSIRSTNSIMLDNMQTTTRIASQNISSNLHLLKSINIIKRAGGIYGIFEGIRTAVLYLYYEGSIS